MELLLDENNLIYTSGSENNTLINFPIWNQKLKIYDRKIIVEYKKKMKIINLKNLGDWMNFFKLYNRKQYIYQDFNLESFKYGLTIYQEFDQNKNDLISYLYKFSKWNIDDINDILRSLNIENIKIYRDNNFTVCDTDFIPTKNIFEKIQNWIDEKNINNIFSFFFALTLIYGDFDIIWNNLNNAKIFFPLNFNLISYKDDIENLFNFLEKEWILFKFDLVQKWIGYVLQIIINDWEFLFSVKNYLKNILELESVIKYNNAKNTANKLLSFAEENNLNWSIIKDKILKIHTK